MTKHPFRTTEILAVAACCLMLLSLSLPALQRARLDAKARLCQANLKDIGEAFAQYAIDFNHVYPGYHKKKGGNRTWGRILVTDGHYIMGPKMLSCPENTSPHAPANVTSAYAVWDFSCYGFYAGNVSVDGWDYARRVRNSAGDFARGALYAPEGYHLELNRIRHPENLAFLADSAQITSPHTPVSYVSPRSLYQRGGVNLIHQNRALSLHINGSVMALYAKQLQDTELGFTVFVKPDWTTLEYHHENP